MPKNKSKIDPNSQDGVVIDTKHKKEKKPKKKKGKLFAFLFLIIVIGAFVVMYWLNIFSLKQRVFDVFVKNDRDYSLKMAQLDNEIEKTTNERDLAMQAQTDYEQKLQDLEQREQDVLDSEAQLEERLRNAIGEDGEDEDGQTSGTSSLQSYVAVFENMSPENASLILQGMNDIDSTAYILSAMDETSAAEILEVFPAEFASVVAQRMLP